MQPWLRSARKAVAVLLIAAFNLVFTMRPVAAAATATDMSSARQPLRHEQQLEERLLNLKRDVRKQVEGGANTGSTVDLAAVKRDLAVMQKTAEAALQRTGTELNSKRLPAPAQERHQAFVNRYQQALSRLDQALSAAMAAPAERTRLQALLATLGEFTPSDRAQPLGTALPHDIVHLSPPAPTLGAGITPAYATATPAGTAATGTTGAPPVPADSGETPETALTPAIRAKADELGRDPVRLYEFVRNTIRFEPYGGSRKGAAQTLAEGSGNDWDQATLLIALYRAAGFPARYVTGTVELPADRASRWLGVQGGRQAVELLASGGIPVSGIAAGGDYQSVQVGHVWVEAFVEVGDYRGIAAGDHERGWVPVDPSFKQSQPVPGLDLARYPLPADLSETFRNQLVIEPQQNAFTSLNAPALADQLDGFVQRVQQDLTGSGTTTVTLDQLAGKQALQAEEWGLLPFSLPYQTVNVQSEAPAVPADSQTAATIALRSDDPFGLAFDPTPALTFRAPLADLYGRRVTFAYRPATPDDAAIIKSYGSIMSTPPYLVHVVPELRLDGAVVATGTAVGLGERQSAAVHFVLGGQDLSGGTYPLVTGGVYALALDGGVTLDRAKETAARMAATQVPRSYDAIMPENVLGTLLNTAGEVYWAESGMFEALLARRSGVVQARMPRAGMVGFDLAVSYLFLSPAALDPGSMFFDIKQNTVAVISQTGDREAVKRYMMTSGLVGSALENAVWEQLTGYRSVSSVRLLAMANSLAIPTYQLDQSNVNTILPTLNLSDGVKSEVAGAVARGRVVIVPGATLEVGAWRGAGYIVFDPDTGAAGYMIQGGHAGGATTVILTVAVLVAAFYLAWVMVPVIWTLLIAYAETGLVAHEMMLFLSIAFTGDVVHDVWDYFHGDTAAGGRVITAAVFTAAIGLVFRAVGGIAGKVVRSQASVVDEAFLAVDKATNGAASRLMAQGLSKSEVLAIGAGVDLEALEIFVTRTPGLPPEFLKSIPAQLEGGVLNSELRRFQSDYVTVNLAKLTQAVEKLKVNPNDASALRTIDGAMKGLLGAHTEYIGELEIVKEGGTLIIGRAHVNAPGADMVAGYGPKVAAVEAKTTLDPSRLFSPSDFTTYLSQSNGKWVFDTSRFLAGLPKAITLSQRRAIITALDNGTFELRIIINSPNSSPISQGVADLLTNGVDYVAPGLATKTMPVRVTPIWR